MSVELKVKYNEAENSHIIFQLLNDEVVLLVKLDDQVVNMSFDPIYWPAIKAFIDQQLSEAPHDSE